MPNRGTESSSSRDKGTTRHESRGQGRSQGQRGWSPLRSPRIGAEVITAPLPDISDHGEQAETVRRKGTRGRRCGVAILSEINIREHALPNVAHMVTLGEHVVAPWIALLFKAAARAVFPFGLCRKPMAGPFAIRVRVVP